MKIKVLVVDDNAVLAGTIEKYFNSSEKLEVVSKVSNGEEAISLLKSNFQFDVMILDIIMPQKDGMAVLEYMKLNNIDKKVIIASSFCNEQTIEKANSYGVKYYLLKPFNLEDLKNKVIEINDYKVELKVNLEEKEKQVKLTDLLHNLGIPSHIKGYQYIRTAILMVYENPKYIGGITKELYPDISVKFNTTIQRVERAIRHAIEVSWLRGDIDLMDEIFGHSVDIDKSKPTNSEFIVTLADRMKLDEIGSNHIYFNN